MYVCIACIFQHINYRLYTLAKISIIIQNVFGVKLATRISLPYCLPKKCLQNKISAKVNFWQRWIFGGCCMISICLDYIVSTPNSRSFANLRVNICYHLAEHRTKQQQNLIQWLAEILLGVGLASKLSEHYMYTMHTTKLIHEQHIQFAKHHIKQHHNPI
jgi:hypothetical protein